MMRKIFELVAQRTAFIGRSTAQTYAEIERIKEETRRIEASADATRAAASIKRAEAEKLLADAEKMKAESLKRLSLCDQNETQSLSALIDKIEKIPDPDQRKAILNLLRQGSVPEPAPRTYH